MAVKGIDDSVRFGKKLYNAMVSETMTSLSLIGIALAEIFLPQLKIFMMIITLFFALRSVIYKFADSYDERRIKGNTAIKIKELGDNHNEKMSKDMVDKIAIQSETDIALSKEKNEYKLLENEFERIKLQRDVFELKRDIIKQQENFRGNIMLTRLKNLESRNDFGMKLALLSAEANGVSKTELAKVEEEFNQIDDDVMFLITDGINAPFEQIAIDKKIIGTVPNSFKVTDDKFKQLKIGEDNDE